MNGQGDIQCVAQSQALSKIAMTAPVSQAETANGRRVRFFLPRDLRLANAPVPNNEKVELTQVAPETCAVLRFSGSRGAAALVSRSGELDRAVASSDWRAVSPTVAWF